MFSSSFVYVRFAFLLLTMLGFASTSHGIVVTATDVSNASPSPGTGDLGATTASVSGIDFIASGGTNDHLGFEAGSGSSVDTIGVFGGQNGRIASGELLTIDFMSFADVNQITLGRFGNNDVEATLTGFMGDPGASLNGSMGDNNVLLDPFDTQSNTLRIVPNGFSNTVVIDFANMVDTVSLSIGSPTTNGGSGGIGFASIDFTPGAVIVPGDVDGDGIVEPATSVNDLGDDLGPIITNFFTDVNMRNQGDIAAPFGSVDFADFRQWKDACLGDSQCSSGLPAGLSLSQLLSGVVPEPGSGALLVFGFLISVCTSRHDRHSR